MYGKVISMGNIYHYCSLDTFAQIIKNKTIRLSDLNKTNDYMEKKWGMKLLYRTLCDELQDRGIVMDLKEDYWYSDNAHNHLEQLENDIKSYLNHQTLITCFSTKKDMLSQWRAYGNDGVGIAIGFDYNLFKKILKPEKKFFIDNVIYKKEKQEKKIKEELFAPAFMHLENMFAQDAVRCSDDYNVYFVEEFDCFCEYMDDAERLFPFLKNPAFEEEKEVRIVYNTGIYEEIEDKEFLSYTSEAIPIGRNEEFLLQPMQYVVKKDKLVAYADLKFESCINDGIIKEIVIGPKAKVSIDDVYRFLLLNGICSGVKISISESSYQ